MSGRIVGLFSHPTRSFKRHENPLPMTEETKLQFEANKGIVGSRFYGKARQVTLIEREILNRHGSVLDIDIASNAVRSNIITEGIDLMAPIIQRFGADEYDSKETKRQLLGANICFRLGSDVIVRVYQLREPCWKMDLISPGLQDIMWGRPTHGGSGHLDQGLIAQVVSDGWISLGDTITLSESGRDLNNRFAPL